MSSSLLSGRLVRLTAVEVEDDARTVSEWTHRPYDNGSSDALLATPQSSDEVKAFLEEVGKDRHHELWFAGRRLEDGLLVGLVGLRNLDWSNQAAKLTLRIDPEQVGDGPLLDELVSLVTAYAFDELNLFRLGMILPEYATLLLDCAQRLGFSIEVRRREAVYRGGQRWDLLMLGLLREERPGRSATGEGENGRTSLISG